MKTNIGIETSDEERLAIGETLGTGKMVTRKELTEAVQDFVQNLISPSVVGDDEKPGGEVSLPSSPLGDFVPSRGDEPYLLKPEDPKLRDILSRMLDLADEYEAYIWEKHNDNRVTERKPFKRGD